MSESQQRLIRGLEIPDRQPGAPSGDSITDEDRIRIWLKIVYEFWGYCINAPSSLSEPGAMLAKTFPSGFENDDVVASGIDGVTQYATPGLFFANSIEWGPEHLGKYIVCWKPNSESADDSIYRILSVVNSDTVQVDAMGGGGTVTRGNRPTFEDRSGIYFRVVGIDDVGDLAGWADNMGMILTFSGSSSVNAEQLPSQARIFIDTISGQKEVKIQVSPSGSWNGSSFSDGSSTKSPARAWTSVSDGSSFFYFAGSKDHLVSVMTSDVDSTYSGIHIEIPRRLYPKEIDPNPIVFMTYGTAPISWNDNGVEGDYSYGNNLWTVAVDGTTQRIYPAHRMFVSPIFEQLQAGTAFWSNPGVATENSFEERGTGDVTNDGRYHEFEINDVDQRVLSSDVVCYQHDVSRFSMCRFRLRKVRASHGHQPQGKRHGRNWIHLRDGVLLPWDNSFIHHGPFWMRL